MASNVDILIIDDDAYLGEMLSLHFDDLGYTCKTVQTGNSGVQFLENYTARLILMDQHLPDTLGIKLLAQIKEKDMNQPVLMITGKHDMQLAIEAIKLGAFDYIHKPIDVTELNNAVEKSLRPRGAATQKISSDVAEKASNEPVLIGTSKAMLDVVKTIAIASQSDATILIQGETGTGKELVAKAIHYHSKKEGPFLAINCSAIVDNLLESELFGHEKGSFTGAVERKDGKFTLAENGTLFLDEIGELSPNLQAKLLRVLQEGTYERVGGTETLKTNTHVVAATHRNLEAMIAEGMFREDLLYRLKILTITIPPLRERMEDLYLLVPHLLGKIKTKLGKDVQGITDNALKKLNSYHWPGNIRELENTLTRAAAMSRTGVIAADLIQFSTDALPHEQQETLAQTEPKDLPTLEEIEKVHIEEVLKAHHYHKGKTCAVLGISRPALDRKIKKYNIELY